MTRLTRDEQLTLMTFFTIFRSPLMYGGDLPTMDKWTLSLLTNEEVLRMHREGTDVRQLFNEDGRVAVTSRNANTGETYLALFNIADKEQTVTASTSSLAIKGKTKLTDLWTGKSSGKASGKISKKLAPHACVLYKLSK